MDSELASCKLDELKFEEKLGAGSFGLVVAAVHMKTGKRVAVKKIPKKNLNSLREREKIKTEVRIHELVNHEHIVRLYKTLEDKSFVYLVMEYAEKGALFKLLKAQRGFDEATAFRYFI